MPPIAFVTSRALPHLTDDDRLAVAALADLGLRAVPALWDDDGVDWTAYAAVVVRSPWDYFLRAGEFAAWLDRLERLGAPVWNPVPLLRWNMDKRYLRELEAAGVRCVPTRWVEGDDAPPLEDVLRERGWSRAVVKPVISGGAHETWMVERGGAHDEGRFRRLAAAGAMVQPFVEEIATEGEWSLVFLGGEYSHALLKRPAPGDFRVQTAHGGRERPARPTPELLDAARATLAAVRHPWLYARVDLCLHAGAPALMELEMLEPSLFLEGDAAAPARFARAIAERAASSRRAA